MIKVYATYNILSRYDKKPVPAWIRTIKKYTICSVQHGSNAFLRNGGYTVSLIGFDVAAPTAKEK